MEQSPTGSAKAPPLWVRVGKLDLPVFFPAPDSGKKVVGFHLDFSGLSGDGFLELRAVDPTRIASSGWWSLDEPVVFEFRASVRAESLIVAVEKSGDFVEQALDRLTFLFGAPARLLEFGIVYNETQLLECRAGVRTEYECSTGGTFCRTTQPAANLHIVSSMRPSQSAKRALRWLRKGMSFENTEDRFLAYYFALECISNDVKQTEEKTHRCKNCGQSTGIGKAQTDGIRELISRHPELPSNTFQILASTRGKLAHGEPASEAVQLESIAQRLAAEGIALSLSIEPASVRIVDSSKPQIVPIMTAASGDHDSTSKWGRTVTKVLEDLRERLNGAD